MRLKFLLILLMAASGLCSADSGVFSPLPLIRRLDSRDTIFKQYLGDVEDARRLLFSSRRGGLGDTNPGENDVSLNIASSLTIFSYIPGDNDDLLGIAARCNIPYGTLVSLNRLSHREDLISGKTLLLPSVPGIFIPEKPVTDLERLLSARADAGADGSFVLSIPREGKTEKFLFIPGDDFSPPERIFFLNRGFGFPLKNFRVSSFYGPRINPVTGKAGVHRGLDLAAPEGTEVHTVRAGTVIDQGEDPILGNYIIISHGNDWISVYGHLSVINTALHAALESTSLIGRVGSTGQSTGPHLHFELRQDGQSKDPARLLGIFRGTAGQ